MKEPAKDSTENNTGDNSGGNAGDNTENSTEDNTGDNSSENAEDNVGDNSGGNSEDNSGGNAEENTEENTEENAKENAKEITLAFNAVDGIFASTGTATKTLTGKYGDAIPLTALGELSKTGYTFAGWNPSISETFPAENATYVAQWTPKKITLTFNANGGMWNDTSSTADKTITGDYDTPLAESLELSKTGYIFTGWNPSIPETFPAENATYTAQWTIENYTITYNLNSGTNNDNNIETYNIDTETFSISDATRVGYTFDGWFETSDCLGTKTTTITKGVRTGNITLWAKWTPKKITLTFNANGGMWNDTSSTADKTITGDCDTPLTESLELSKTGYTFAGWNPPVPETFPAENATYTATWTSNTASITVTLPSTVPTEIGSLTYDDTDKNNIKFTAANGHTTYAWWVDGSKTNSTGSTFTLETTNLKGGTHSVMVVVDSLYSSTITVRITK